MFALDTVMAVYLHRDAIDFRKGINGLVALVEQELQLDPFSLACFAFCNRQRNKVKILFWQTNGFWLLQKRLESANKFIWPRLGDDVLRLNVQQLHWLLDGFNLAAMKGHQPLHYQRAS